MVAQRIAHLPPETILEILLNSLRNQQLGAWQDQWQPSIVLRQCGFEVPEAAETIEAVGANVHGRDGDLVITYHKGSMSH